MRISGWLFLLQQIFSSLMLLMAAGRCLHVRLPLMRLLAASILSGGASTLACSAPSPWSSAAAAAALIAAPHLSGLRLPRAGRIRLLMLLMLLSFFCSGLLRAASDLLPPALLPLCAAMALLLPALDRRIPAPSCASVAITLSGRRIRLTALLDSGNLLRDPLTSLPVIVCSRRALMPLDPMRCRLRLISVRTAAGSALMPIFRADSVQLLTGGAWRGVSALIGIAPESYDGFQALVPASLAASASAPSSAVLSS